MQTTQGVKTRGLPTRPITSVEDLRRIFRNDESLPDTKEEMEGIMSMPPDDWFDRVVLFPRVVSPAQTEGQGDEVVSESIASYHWNSTSKKWEVKYLLAGPNGWGRNGPDQVEDTAIIPKRS